MIPYWPKEKNILKCVDIFQFLVNLVLALCFPGGSDGKASAYNAEDLQSLGQEDPLEKGMAIHFSILAWRIPWTEEPGGLYSSWGRRVCHD